MCSTNPTDQAISPVALFAIGQVVATPGALELFNQYQQSPFTFIRRHVHGDWGAICKEDQHTNNIAVKTGARILSAYLIDPDDDSTRIWIITEASREVTTLLRPDEY